MVGCESDSFSFPSIIFPMDNITEDRCIDGGCWQDDNTRSSNYSNPTKFVDVIIIIIIIGPFGIALRSSYLDILYFSCRE
jgi:hypothetical protein